MQLVDSYASVNDKVTAAILVLQTIGFAEYKANICQFCIDQFPDVSTNAIKSFISWFIWTYLTGGIAGHCIYECIGKQYYVAGTMFHFYLPHHSTHVVFVKWYLRQLASGTKPLQAGLRHQVCSAK